MSDKSLIKHSGQIFTPDYLVREMLNFCGYTSKILKKHIIDNSCGNGAFLTEVVSRYCQAYFKKESNKEQLKRELETYIHGIEINNSSFTNCLFNLDQVAKGYGLNNVRWDIRHANALKVSEYNNKMDFVVGNPPYVRVHNLKENYNTVKTFSFATGGMTDLFLVFFQLGFQMLNTTGRLCYISPSSWLKSLAAKSLREYILDRHNLVGIIDLQHFQAFDKITTYSIISLFDNSFSESVFDYYVYADQQTCLACQLSYDEITISNEFYIAKKEDLATLKAIKLSEPKKHCVVKNGFATLADKIFIENISINDYTIPILKASTGKWKRGFFPYDKKGNPIPEDEIFNNDAVAQYLKANKKALLKGKSEKANTNWYRYGRSQALKDVYKEKIAINSIIRDVDSIKLTHVSAGSGIYSGLYILTQFPFSTIESIIKTEDFINYVKALKKYKSGGYYTFNTKDLQDYLNYKLSQGIYHEKPIY